MSNLIWLLWRVNSFVIEQTPDHQVVNVFVMRFGGIWELGYQCLTKNYLFIKFFLEARWDLKNKEETVEFELRISIFHRLNLEVKVTFSKKITFSYYFDIKIALYYKNRQKTLQSNFDPLHVRNFFSLPTLLPFTD